MRFEAFSLYSWTPYFSVGSSYLLVHILRPSVQVALLIRTFACVAIFQCIVDCEAEFMNVIICLSIFLSSHLFLLYLSI